MNGEWEKHLEEKNVIRSGSVKKREKRFQRERPRRFSRFVELLSETHYFKCRMLEFWVYFFFF